MAKRSASPSRSTAATGRLSYIATTGGITAEDVRDLMVVTVEHRFSHLSAR